MSEIITANILLILLLHSYRQHAGFADKFSAPDKGLIRLYERGHIIEQQIDTAREFSQPEGLLFTLPRNRLISNEGRNRPSTILLFIQKNSNDESIAFFPAL